MALYFREKKIEGLTFLRCLVRYHSDVLSSRLHDVCLALIQEVSHYIASHFVLQVCTCICHSGPH